MKLHETSTIPLYQQLMDNIKARLDSHEFQVGESIPSEQQLIEDYGVSRITVRKAIDELCAMGYLAKKQGKGTFVAKHKVHRKIMNIQGFGNACRECGMTPSYLLLDMEVVKAQKDACDFFGLTGSNSDLIYIQRLCLADDEPILLESTLYSYDKYAFLLQSDLSGSLYDLLDAHHVRPINTRTCTLEIERANNTTANIMKIPLGEPLFFVNSYMTLEGDIPAAIERNYIVGSRYYFNIS